MTSSSPDMSSSSSSLSTDTLSGFVSTSLTKSPDTIQKIVESDKSLAKEFTKQVTTSTMEEIVNIVSDSDTAVVAFRTGKAFQQKMSTTDAMYYVFGGYESLIGLG